MAAQTSSTARPTMRRILLENVLVALACVTGAWVSRWLTVPALGWTPVVLPAGVAMSAVLLIGPRIVPALFLATTACAYLRCGFDGALLPVEPDAVACAAASLGLVAESLLGRYLARDFLRERRRIESVPTGLHLMMLVGPYATIVGALSIVAPDYLAGRTEWQDMLVPLLTTWVARTIAVWIFLLPTWAWISNPRGSRSSSLQSVALPVASGFAVMTAAFLLVRATEHERLHHDFDELARTSTGDLRNETMHTLDGMQAIVAFLLASDHVDQDEFQLFAKRVFDKAPGLDTVSWLPRVSREGRAEFERIASRENKQPVVIRDLDAKGLFSAAPERAEYFPESLVGPTAPNVDDLFIDTSGCSNMAVAMREARLHRKPVATEPLDQDDGSRTDLSVLVFVPVFSPTPAVATANDGLRGYVVASFYTRPLVEASFHAAKRKYLDVKLEDCTSGAHLVYAYKSNSTPLERDMAQQAGLEFSSYGIIAGRRWLITLTPTPAYLSAHASSATWFAGVLGYAACVVLGLYGLMLSGRRGRIEELVTARTHELSVTIDRLVTANEIALVASRAKNQFLANMSHELRTPLLSVLGFTDMMSRNVGSEADRRAWSETVHRNGKHLLTILNDVMDVARLEAGQLAIEKGPVSLVAALNDSVRSFQDAARAKGLSLGAAITSPVPATIETDSTRLRQILSQLINNAVKFTEHGSIRVLATSIATDRIEIRVIDTGPGIPRDQLESVFEPFTQGDGSMTRRHGGQGLGCTIARRLAVLMGGSLRVESELGLGTQFVLELDVGDAARNGVVASLDAEPVVAVPGADVLANARILVAEDSDDTQLLLSAVLGRAGAELVLAHDGRSALGAFDAAVADGRGFDLVLLDIQMPVLDGYQTARELRRRGFEGPILALTAHAMQADRERCIAAGCDGYVTKPFEPFVLLDTCRRQLALVPRTSTTPTTKSGAPSAAPEATAAPRADDSRPARGSR